MEQDWACDRLVAGAADHIIMRLLPQMSEIMPIRFRKLVGAIMLIARRSLTAHRL
jgi:hypothetical protein